MFTHDSFPSRQTLTSTGLDVTRGIVFTLASFLASWSPGACFTTSKVNKNNLFIYLFLEDISPFCGAKHTLVFDFR